MDARRAGNRSQVAHNSQRLQLGTHLGRVRMLEIIQGSQGLLPCVTGRLMVTRGLQGVAEVGKDLSLVIAIAQRAENAQGLLAAGDGLRVVPELMMCVAEAIQGRGLAAAKAAPAEPGQGPLAFGDGPLVVTQPDVVPADIVLRAGLAHTVALGPEEVACLLGMGERLTITALQFQ